VLRIVNNAGIFLGMYNVVDESIENFNRTMVSGFLATISIEMGIANT
jgi:hypothetical protein